jgi:hypothetical protein
VTQHAHPEPVHGCFRCDLSRDEFDPPRPGEPGWDEWIDYCAEVEDSEIDAWREMRGLR